MVTRRCSCWSAAAAARSRGSRSTRRVESRRLGQFPCGTLVVNLGGCSCSGCSSASPPAPRDGGARHRDDRLLHDVLDLDARDPSPGAGRRARASHGSTSLADLAAGFVAISSDGAREGRCERAGDQAHDVLQRAQRAATGSSQTRCSTSTSAIEMRTSVLLRGVEGFGAAAPAAYRPAADAVREPAGRIDRGRRSRRDRARGPRCAADRNARPDQPRARAARRRRRLRGSELPDEPRRGLKLTVYGGRVVRAGGQAGYVAAVDAAASARRRRRLGAARGRRDAARRRRRARFFARNAGVPLMLLAIGERRGLRAALPALRELFDDPVVTIERVQICKSAGAALGTATVPERGPLRAADPAEADGARRGAGQARRTPAPRPARAPAARGRRRRRHRAARVRGFYGDHEPFADRLLSLRRNVPVTWSWSTRPRTCGGGGRSSTS